jgi:hypothetical protein
MALVDEMLFKNEMLMIKNFATASNFEEHEAQQLINLLINGIKYGKKEIDLFNTFKQAK